MHGPASHLPAEFVDRLSQHAHSFVGIGNLEDSYGPAIAAIGANVTVIDIDVLGGQLLAEVGERAGLIAQFDK